ncbi:MAG: YihY/virulence factor BrkB family protein [Candidatus Limnocylindria bacterium]
MIERATRRLTELDAELRRRPWTRIPRRAIVGFLAHDALRYAGSMAYFAILSLFQIIVLGIVAATFFLGEGRAREVLVERITSATPFDADTVRTVIGATIEARGSMTLIGIVVLIWSGLGIFAAISHGIGRAFDSDLPRAFIGEKLVGLFLMGLVGLMAVASLVIGLVTGIIERMAAELPGALPGSQVAWAISTLLPLALIVAAFWIIYRVVPPRTISPSHALLGAVVATFLWTLLRIGFTWYATRVADYESLFGPISSAITLLVFLYFASVVVLIGAEVVAAVAHDDERAPNQS